MNLVKFSIKNPVTILVAVLLTLLFGYLSLQKLPYQLTPNVTKPQITITTMWPGASPYEVEREIIEEQESVIRSISRLEEYESSSQNNLGQITLFFELGTDIQQALIDVSNQLDQVPSYPENVDRPIIRSSSASPVIWMMLQTMSENERHIDEYKTYFEDEIKPMFERIEGVADTRGGGGTESEMHIIIDPDKLAAHNITLTQFYNTLRAENVDISSGLKDISRRSYRVRTVGKLTTPQDIENVVIYSTRDKILRVKDLARVTKGYEDKQTVAMFLGTDGMGMGIQPRPDANVVDLTNRVEKEFQRINDEILNPQGLKLEWLYDQRPYIVGSVETVQKNILIGGVLAVFVLIIFLRSVTPTAVVATAIPISIIGTFIVLDVMGRSLNTISLAGISFAVGMLIDSAIVVLENIDRHRKNGDDIFTASYKGTTEVWGALLASASTTMAVFLPIVFLQDEAGQLFKDIAIAVIGAVSFALFVSITVIPMLWKKFSQFRNSDDTQNEGVKKPSLFVVFGQKMSDFLMSIVQFTIKNIATRIASVVLLSALSVGMIYSMFPKMDYLPQGNQNFILNILIPPPGLSQSERHEIGMNFMEQLEPYVNEEVDGYPPINRAFFISFRQFVLLGVTSGHEQRARELIPLLQPIVNSQPGVMGVTMQAGVFERGIGEGKVVNLDISGPNLEQLTQVGGQLMQMSNEAIEGAQVRPVPSIELLYPEANIIGDREALSAVGMSTQDLGMVVDIMMGGRKVGDYEHEGEKKIDMVIKADTQMVQTPQDILKREITLPSGKKVLIESIANLEETTGISEIRHYEGQRTVTLQVTPPAHMTIQEAMERLEGMVQKIQQEGDYENVNFGLSGTADKLTQTIDMILENFLLAILIVYLLMSALFGNFLYPLVIMFTVPLATAGGFLGLKLTDTFLSPQPLDVLTMLGFIILVGIVVNNAILIVHQSLNYIRNYAMEHKKAVVEATRSRIRPIFMSSLTSIFGMLPLVLLPGPGTEFYRGLGSVITGGLALSTFFTLFIIPAMLMFFIKMEKIPKKEGEDEK
ncbi:MAG: efflux RND transporter permease subunit [Campylobacterota bacterium]